MISIANQFNDSKARLLHTLRDAVQIHAIHVCIHRINTDSVFNSIEVEGNFVWICLPTGYSCVHQEVSKHTHARTRGAHVCNCIKFVVTLKLCIFIAYQGKLSINVFNKMQCAEYFSFHIYQYDFYFVVFLPRFI